MYFKCKKEMIRHLSSCVNPIRRRANTNYSFPKNPNGNELCPLCFAKPVAPKTLQYHILKRHEKDTEELRAWGYDFELIRVQSGEIKKSNMSYLP